MGIHEFLFSFSAIYYVKERCQDGWFRGVNRAQKTGVFPGNYVAQLRTLNEQHSNGHSASGAGAIGLSGHSKRSAAASNSGGATNVTALSKGGNPPDLPPRSSGSSSSSSSTSTSVWSKPIGQHVEALFGRKKNQVASLRFYVALFEYVGSRLVSLSHHSNAEKKSIQFDTHIY